jgi:hypothetical protein
MAAECAEFHSKVSELKMFGFGISDQSFYSISIPGEGGHRRRQPSFRFFRVMHLRRKWRMN